MLQQSKELQAVFVGHAGMIGGETPVGPKLLALVQAQSEICVTDVDRQEHAHLNLIAKA
jgi:hypothetical protein